MARLQQGVFGSEALHALTLQCLNGAPVEFATVLRLSVRPSLLPDVVEP